MGSTKQGMLVREFTTELFGVRQHAYARGSNTTRGIVLRIIENRVELVTTGDIRGVAYPALLATERVSTPVGTRAVVTIEIQRIGDLPEMRAFGALEPDFLQKRECLEPLEVGTTLPVTYDSDRGPQMAAMKILGRIAGEKFDAVIFHEADKKQPAKGNVLTRRVTLRNLGRMGKFAEAGKVFEFSARIGVVVSVL